VDRQVSGSRSGGPPGRLLFAAANPSVDRLYELDRLKVGEIHRPRSIVAVAGGKGLNAARAAATLGGSVTAVAIVGGRAGDWIGERLAQQGINARLAHASGETRTCVSILDRSSGELTEIYEHGDEIGPGEWDAFQAIVGAELERGDVALVALSGSLPPGAPPDGYGPIARIAAAGSHHVAVLADTYGPALGAVLAEHPAIVKLNAAEAGEASGVPVSDVVSAAAAATVLGDIGAASVVVTVGLAGAVVLSDGQRTHLVPPDDRGPYSVGSGDAFFGGLAVAFGRGESVVEAARLGLAAGIANAQVPGAGELDPRAVDAILRRITSTSI
jgi:1-phosphofructokinase family hexose kinase